MLPLYVAVVALSCVAISGGDAASPRPLYYSIRRSDAELPAMLASFGAVPDDRLVLTVIRPDPIHACWPLLTYVGGKAVLVRRGDCNFEEKAENVQKAGAAALLVYSDSPLFAMSESASTNASITIPAFMVRSADIADLGSLEERVTVAKYSQPLWGVLLLFVLSVGTVVGGAYMSSARERSIARGAEVAEDSDIPLEEVTQLTIHSAIAFVGIASLVLLLLYYFSNYLIYFVIFVFSVSGTCGLMVLFAAPARALFPRSDRHIQIPCLGNVYFLYLILFLLCTPITITWIIGRNSSWSWVLQDLIGIGFLILIQRTIHFPNIKVSSCLLVLAFFYDVFWVFLSGYIFRKSVMISVASGGRSGERVPMMLRAPHFGNIFGGESIIGFGDIALPGLLISFLLRYDYTNKTLRPSQGYFVIGVFGYCAGLIITDLVMVIFEHGQPALLYLVPCTLGVVVILALQRGDFSKLWIGQEAELLSETTDDSPDTSCILSNENV